MPSPDNPTLRERGPDGRFLSADCEKACQLRCAYPGQFGCDDSTDEAP